MPICVLKRGDLCDRMSSRENEARFLHQNEVNFHACICTGSPNASTKLDLQSPIVNRDKNLSTDYANSITV